MSVDSIKKDIRVAAAQDTTPQSGKVEPFFARPASPPRRRGEGGQGGKKTPDATSIDPWAWCQANPGKAAAIGVVAFLILRKLL